MEVLSPLKIGRAAQTSAIPGVGPVWTVATGRTLEDAATRSDGQCSRSAGAESRTSTLSHLVLGPRERMGVGGTLTLGFQRTGIGSSSTPKWDSSHVLLIAVARRGFLQAGYPCSSGRSAADFAFSGIARGVVGV